MKIHESKATLSAIISAGQKLRKLEKETGKKYLFTNRGVNAVVPIDLNPVIEQINFNSSRIQTYAGFQGYANFREAINSAYFQGATSSDNIFVTGGAIQGLDLVFQIINVDTFFFPPFYWGTYTKVATIRQQHFASYNDFEWLKNNLQKLKNSAVIICEPNNPLGSKHPDNEIIDLIEQLNANGTVVIVDSPYRHLFILENDTFYRRLSAMENVVIVESFSKSIGLSGLRTGFLHAANADFRREAAIRLLYASNGVNAFSQELIFRLLTTPEGKKSLADFKQQTTAAIAKNIAFLHEHQLLAEEFYQTAEPKGIFVVVNRRQEELLQHRIGSVTLRFFTQKQDKKIDNYARICVSVPHDVFCEFFQPLI